MTIALTSGLNTLAQNTVYATPGLSKWCVAGSALEVSTTVGGTFAAVAATSTGVVLGGALFVRCTSGTTTCVLSNQ